MAPLIVIGGAAGPADLTAARIRRANPSIDKEAARELAAELHDIVADARVRWAAESGSADENYLIQTMMREIVDDRPPGDAAAYDAGADASIYLACMLTDPDDPNDLYLRYMRLFDRINGTDMVGDFDMDGRAAKRQGWCLVRDDLPPLDTLIQAAVAAVRLAQKGEGSNKILELLPAFKDATGLQFIMNADERHRSALFDLVQTAGIPVV